MLTRETLPLSLDEQTFQNLIYWSSPNVALVVALVFIVALAIGVLHDLHEWRPVPNSLEKYYNALLSLSIVLVQIGTLAYFMFATYMWGCGRLYLPM